MRLNYQNILGFLLCFMLCRSIGNASIIVSFIDKTVLDSANASFEVYASANSGNEIIGGYGFTVTLNYVPVGGLAATQVTPVPVAAGTTDNKWSGLFRDAGGPVIGTNSVTFKGGGPPTGGLNLDPYNVSIATGQVPNTLIGTVSFVRDPHTTYTISMTPTTTGRLEFATTGFLKVDQQPDGFGGFNATSVQVGSTFNNFAITAVPEPSTMALVSLALGGLGLKRLQSRRKRQAK